MYQQPDQNYQQQQYQQPSYPNYQPPPQGYPQQQMNYAPARPPQFTPPPMPMTPPPQKSKKWPWIVALIIVFFVGFGLGHIGTTDANTGTAVTSSNNSSSPTSKAASSTASSATATQQPASQQPATAKHYKVGDVVNVGNIWQVTFTSARTSQGDTISQPKAGNVYLLLDVSLKNISSQEQTVSSLISFDLRDNSGKQYTEALTTFSKPPDGKVEAGSPLSGTLAYEVPTAQHQFTMNFQADIMKEGQTVWDISI